MLQEDEADIRQPVSDDAQPELAADSDAAAETGLDDIMLIESEAEAEPPQAADAQAEAAGAVGMAEGEAEGAPAETAEPREEARRLSRAESAACDRQQRRWARAV